MYSYPFVLKLPDWLPASMVFFSIHERAHLEIKYFLEAQFTPRDHHAWASADTRVSTFRTQMPVYLYRPSIILPNVDLKF